jgi:predicted  nucleic acid-binding Zn-ribbon protein
MNAFAQSDDQKKILAIHEANMSRQISEVAAQKKRISELENTVKDLQRQIKDLNTNLSTSVDELKRSADSSMQKAKEAADRAFGSIPVAGAFDGTQFTSCNSKCSSMGMRCLTGQANPIASAFAVPCSQPTNVCICAAF